MTGSNHLSRFWVAALGVLAIALLLLVRLYSVQIVNGDKYADKADRQYMKPNSTVFDRGSIFFTAKDGNKISAAGLKTGFTIAIKPSAIKDAEAAYSAISKFAKVEKSEFMAKAARREDPYEEIAKRVDQNAADSIKALEIPGVGIYKERWRYYSGDSLASQVLGFVGYVGDTLKGRYGIERYYDDVLSRDSGASFSNFFAEIFSGIGSAIASDSRMRGDIETSIEPTVESKLEDELRRISGKWNSKLTGGIIMDPKTGEIIGMAAAPSFNPNSYQDAGDQRVYSNPLVEGIYELGSIFKPLTMAAGLDSGTVRADSLYEDKGYLVLDGRRISNYDGKGRGLVSMQEVLNKSLNTGAAHVALSMGSGKFASYMKSFGFGEETGIDLPNEAAGMTRNLDSGRSIDIATISYGHGIAVSPVAVIRALASLANGGLLVTPHIAKKIDYDIGISRKLSYGEPEQVLKKETSDEITRMLVKVVDTSLRDGKVKMERHSIAAKTGTALLPSPAGGYYDDKFLHSFFGYFPAYDPRFIVFLYTVDPKGVTYASETLTDSFMSLAKFLITYYEIPPDR